MGLPFGFRFWVQFQCVRPCQRDQHALTQVHHSCHLTNSTVAIEKAWAACAQSFAPWQQATIEFTYRDHSVIACSRHIYIILFFAHIPFMVNHTINSTPMERLQQHPLLFTTNRTDRTFFCVKAELGKTSTSWSQHHFISIGKSRAACAQSFGLWLQATRVHACDHSIIACSRHIYILLYFAHILFVVNHTINATPPESLQHYQLGSPNGK